MAHVKPLSNYEVIAKAREYGYQLHYLPYSQLRYIDSLERHLPLLLLYQLEMPSFGHWVLLFKNGEGLNYFDSTGQLPDWHLEHSFNYNDREGVNADYTYLLDLLSQYPEIVYNEQPLQPSGTNTCGYWSLIRLLCSSLSNDVFNHHYMMLPTKQREEEIVRDYKSI